MNRISACVAMCAVVAFSSGSAVAMDGRHVTNRDTTAMVITTIRNSAVSGTPTTIACNMHNPDFSFDGTKVACWKKNGGKWYLSVMDYSSKTFTDLLDLSTWAGAAPGASGDIRWPYGSWIYFRKPSTMQIWRINYADPAQKEMVRDYASFAPGWEMYNFGLDADANVGLVAYGIQGPWRSHQYVHHFPPTASGPGAAPNFMFDLPNCNPAVSPSGNLVEHFFNGNHRDIIIYRWNAASNTYVNLRNVGRCENNPPLEDNSTCLNSTLNMEPWSGAQDWILELAEVDWAVNSDRWISVGGILPGTTSGINGGCNAIIVSWKDKKCVNLTHNSLGTVSRRGSLFVEGGPANCIQDTNGTWRDLNGNITDVNVSHQSLNRIQSAIARTVIEGRDLNIAVSARSTYTISLLDARGRRIGSAAGMGTNEHALNLKDLKSGVYFVKIQAGRSTETASVVMQ